MRFREQKKINTEREKEKFNLDMNSAMILNDTDYYYVIITALLPYCLD